MNSPLFRAQLFPVERSEKLACVITGYGGKIARYQSVIKTLNERGFTVIAYEHSLSVLTSGNPHDLLNLIDGTCNDFEQRMDGYKKIICLGTSAGSGLCFAMQRRMPNIQYGIYAVAGMSGREALKSPLFYFVRKRFEKRGFSATKLDSLWQEIDVSADEPPRRDLSFVMVLGKRDRIVNYQKSCATLQTWQKAGVPIKIITKPDLGHLGTIKWYKKHTDELLDEAEQLAA